MALLDVNALVALAWTSYVHHTRNARMVCLPRLQPWMGYLSAERERVRPRVVKPEGAAETRLASRRRTGRARGTANPRGNENGFLADDVSLTDPYVPRIAGYRQVTDAHLLTLARRCGVLGSSRSTPGLRASPVDVMSNS